MKHRHRIARLAAGLLALASLAAPLAAAARVPPVQAGWPSQSPARVPGWVPTVPQQIGSPGSPVTWQAGDAGYLHASHMIDARVHEILCEEPYSYGPCR